MEFKDIINSYESFSEKEKQIGQVIRLAVLNGYFVAVMPGAYSGQDSIVMYHVATDPKTGIKTVTKPIMFQTDLDHYNEDITYDAYTKILSPMKKKIDSYLEVGGSYSKVGDKIAREFIESKAKKASHENLYGIIEVASKIRIDSFLSNPVAPTGKLSRALADAVDDQINYDLGQMENERCNRISENNEKE